MAVNEDLADDIADDFEDFDGNDEVVLTIIRAGGSEDITVTSANSGPKSRAGGAALQGGLVGRQRSWSLPVVEVVNAAGEQVAVEVGDKLTIGEGEDEEVWQVDSVDLLTLNTRWLCQCSLQE